MKLIESTDFMTFREVAQLALRTRGFKEVALTDGWSDGGTDVRVYQIPPNPLPLAIQVSVQRDWKSKARADAAKVKEKLGATDLLLVTSRRVPEAEFAKLADEVLAESSVRIQRMDSQGIASLLFEHSLVHDLFRILQIPIHAPDLQSRQRPDMRQEVAYAFSFFGATTEEFRKGVVEQAIRSTLFQAPQDRDTLITSAGGLLGLQPNQRRLVASVIDRMLQVKDLVGTNGSVSLSAAASGAHESMLLIKHRDWQELREQVGNAVVEHAPRRSVRMGDVQAVLEGLGALIVSAGDLAALALSNEMPHAVLREQLRTRLLHLHATLDGIGIDQGEPRNALLEVLVSIGTESALGRHLVAGEVFLAMTSMHTPDLVKALAGKRDLIVMLDSSVSIPVLAGLLYTARTRHFALAARHAYEQLRAHGIEMHLPMDYLEETAAHLVDAYRDYREIVALDADLVGSGNAFVSHYATLLRERGIAKDSFILYLKRFGLDERLVSADYSGAIRVAMNRLQDHFERYGIRVLRLGSPGPEAMRQAKEAIEVIQYERNYRKAPVLARHDQRTVAFLMDRDRSSSQAYFLCTWDGFQFAVREREGRNAPNWHVVDPAFLGDLLALAGTDSQTAVLSPLVIAMEITDAAAEKGALVWDTIASVEKGYMHDAELIEKAQEFKADYLRRAADNADAASIKQAWMKWKEGRQIELFPTEGH